jgi:Arc/MetJ-type ribon-helix-helix transcriptional regulator
MQPIKKKSKIDVTSTLSPYLKEKMDRLVNEEKFSSVSDLISVAVTELLTRYPDEGVKIESN